jgi:hypothetical protein
MREFEWERKRKLTMLKMQLKFISLGEQNK